MTKPDILEVVERYTPLRKRGREFFGLAPCHKDRSPSLRVNTEKQVWYCDPCARGGDVIDFVMLAEGLTFPEVCKTLGIGRKRKPRRPLTPRRKRAAELGAEWANEQRQKFNSLIAEWFEMRDAADEVGLFDVAEIIDRELVMFAGFYESLTYPAGVAELLAVRESIEAITAGAEDSL